MKLFLLFCVLCTTLSSVYSFHNKHNGQSVSYKERTVNRPANIFVELKQQEPVYSIPLTARQPAKHKHSFDIFGALKKKFAKFASFRPHLFHHQAAAPLPVQYIEQPKFVCSPVVFRPQQESAPIVDQEPHINPAPFYTIPLQGQSSGKNSIFSKIKSHFNGGDSGASLKIVVGNPDVHETQLVNNGYVSSPPEVNEVYARNSNPNVAVKVEDQKSDPNKDFF